MKVNPLTPKRDQDRKSPYMIVYVINKQTCDANKEKKTLKESSIN